MVGTNGTALSQYEDTVELLQERITELELALHDGDGLGWSKIGGGSSREFSRDAIRRIAALARLFYLANPLINRAVSLQAQYVFGQGVNINGRHPDVDEVVQAFLDDEKNRAELTSHQARLMKEIALQTEGNIVFVLFTNTATGRVRVRSLPVDEVEDIITDPEDAKSPWFYKRVWCQRGTDLQTGQTKNEDRTAYYPDWRYQPRTRQARIGDKPVLWDQPIYHVKVGGLPDMRFGVPETYAAHDWARAYKSFLEDVATLMRAYARFAGKVTNLRGAKGVAAGKARMGTTQGANSAETNPPPLTGSIFMGADGVDYTPLNIRGASVNPEDGRRLLLMVCAAVGLPETFLGDVSVGTLATAKSLDRPTELKYKDRQTLWVDIFQHILGFQVKQAVRAKRLRGTVTTTDDGDELVDLGNEIDPDTGQEALDARTGQPIPINPGIDVDFPPVLEHDVGETVGAIVSAATLGGHPLAGTMDAKLAARLLLSALGQDDIDDLLEELFPEEELEDAPDEEVPTGEAPSAVPGTTQPTTEAKRKSVKVKGRGRALRHVPRAKITAKDLYGAARDWDAAMEGRGAAGLLDAEITMDQ